MDYKPKYRVGQRFVELDLTYEFLEIVGVSPEQGYNCLEAELEDIPPTYFYFIEEHMGNKLIYDVIDEQYLEKCCKRIK